MEDKDKMSVTEIEAMHNKVQTGEIEPFEPNTPTWADLLYELSDKDEVQDDGLKAVIKFLKDTVESGAEISTGKFEEFMKDAYKNRWDTKGEYGKQYAHEFFDTDTLDRMDAYIDWDEYAGDLSPDTVVYIQLEEGPYAPVWVFDPNFEF